MSSNEPSSEPSNEEIVPENGTTGTKIIITEHNGHENGVSKTTKINDKKFIEVDGDTLPSRAKMTRTSSLPVTNQEHEL